MAVMTLTNVYEKLPVTVGTLDNRSTHMVEINNMPAGKGLYVAPGEKFPFNDVQLYARDANGREAVVNIVDFVPNYSGSGSSGIKESQIATPEDIKDLFGRGEIDGDGKVATAADIRALFGR